MEGLADISKNELTCVEIRRLRETFCYFDKNGNNKIDIGELKQAMQVFGLNPSDHELNEFMKINDYNKDGYLNFDEFLHSMAEKVIAARDDTSHLEKAFKYFDKNGDGSISIEEMKVALMSVGERMSTKEIQDLFNCADTDANGRLDMKEFINLMRSEAPIPKAEMFF